MGAKAENNNPILPKAHEELNAKKDTSKKKRLGGFLFTRMAKGGAAELSSNAEEVNRLNVFPVPDGDTGDNMRMTIESGISAIENLNSDNLAEVMRVLSHGMLLGARGNSGVILSQFFAGVSAGFENAKEADAVALGAALQRGVKQAYSTVVTPTEGTILTVAREAVDYAVSKTTEKTTIKSFFRNLVSEMYASLERTPDILPKLKEAGVVDSGGAGLFYIMDGFRRVLDGDIPKDEKNEQKSIKNDTHPLLPYEFDPETEFFYCTEMLIMLSHGRKSEGHVAADTIRTGLSEIGDSVATVITDGIMKVHVHTQKPECALKLMHSYGEFLNVKIENMTVQEHKNEQKSKESFTKSPINNFNKEKDNAIIAVTCGEGISNVFYELGADKIIECKNDSNPSVKDFIDAFEEVGAKRIFVLPNNSNVLLAAKQAAQIYANSNVIVIETSSIGMGYAALAAFDGEISDTDRQMGNIYREIRSISDGYVAPAVRDAEFDGIKIKKGNAIGIIGKKIVTCKKSVSECAAELARILLLDKVHLTVFYGERISEKDERKLIKKIKSEVPHAKIYSFYGGQDIYPHILVAR